VLLAPQVKLLRSPQVRTVLAVAALNAAPLDATALAKAL